MPARPKLFRVLLHERGWGSWLVFSVHFEKAARALAEELHKPQLADASVGEATFERWASRNWNGTPRPEAALVLERLFSVPCAELFAPASASTQVSTSHHGPGEIRAAVSIGERWPTSRVSTSGTDGIADSWELAGGHVLDGTVTAVGFRPAAVSGDAAHLHVADGEALRQFVRPARRGLVVGVAEHDGDDGGPQMYVVDAANIRRVQAASPGDSTLALPVAHLLDDLTYGLLWSLVQLDDGLLADDFALAQEQETLESYLSFPRSAPSRVTLPDLTTVGTRWLGSAFCARHIVQGLEGVTAAPVFWTREQTGEQAAPWLWFQHKADYLKTLAARFDDGAVPMVRVFCIPEGEVNRSSRYERILLLLAVALMELHGIRADVLADPDYSDVDGFALVAGERAVVANWVRTGEAIWATDTLTRRHALRGYDDAVNQAHAHSVTAGDDPESRLRLLAGYLDIPWPWLVGRARALGECGTASIVRPRSRHLSADALDEVFRFLGALDGQR